MSSATGGGGGGRPKAGTGRSHHYQPKKMLTEAEKLLEFLVKLGYEPPKNLRPEHLDYLFKSEKGAQFIKDMMAKLRPENVLSKDEVEKLEKLKMNSQLLYGKDLEAAVRRRQALDRQYLEQVQKSEMKKDGMKNSVEEIKKHVDNLRKDQQVLRNISKLKEEAECKRKLMRAKQQQESDQLEMGIEVSRRLLDEKVSKVENCKAAIQERFDGRKRGNGLMCCWDWTKFLDNEEAIHQAVKLMVEASLPQLTAPDTILDVDALEEEKRIHEIINSNKDDLERLRHSIVFEEVRHVKLQRNLKEEETALEVQQSTLLTAEGHLRSGSNLTTLEKQTETRIMTLKEAVEAESSKMLEAIRSNEVTGVNRQFSSLIESNSLTKQRMDEFIYNVYQILEASHVRIHLMMHLSSREMAYYLNFQNIFADLRRKLTELDSDPSSPNKHISDGSDEQRICTNILFQHGYPSDTLNSRVRTFGAFSNIFQTLAKREALLSANRIASNEGEIRNIREQVKKLGIELENLESSTLPSYEVSSLIADTQHFRDVLKKTLDQQVECIKEGEATDIHVLREMEKQLAGL